MTALVLDPGLERELIERRRASGGDRYDEMWEGVYVMAPLADNEHQEMVGDFEDILRAVVRRPGLGRVLPGANVSDRPEDWRDNFRCPDVVVVLNEGRAVDRGSHWFEGPDFLIEIASPGDRSFEKLEFYGRIGVRELLIVERDERTCHLYRLGGEELVLVGRSDESAPETLASQVVPLSFCWCNDPAWGRPKVRVRRTDAAPEEWLV